MKNAFLRSTVWWKFDHYEIAGDAIRPSPDARLRRFDPWKHYYAVAGQYRTVETLWGTFAELGRKLTDVDASAVSAEPQQRILDWSHRFGLLGLLPVQALAISLPPSYELPEEYLHYSASGLRAVVHRSYARFAGHWFGDIQTSGELRSSGGSPYSKQSVQSSKTRQHHDTVSREWIDAPLRIATVDSGQALAPYFPANLAPEHYPAPMQKEFWPSYQEPLAQWVKACRVFSGSARRISGLAAKRWQDPRKPFALSDEDRHALWTLNLLAESEQLYYDFGTIGIQEEAISGSLLSAMAKMFFWDVMAKRRLFTCATCGSLFVSNDLKAQYCKAACRNLAQTRRHRSRLKALREQ